jgi:peptide/nickel transport system permease protein
LTGTIDLARESTADTEVSGIQARTPLELFWRRLREDRVAMAAFAFVVMLIIVAIAAPLIVKLVGARPPDQQATKYLDSFGTPTGPSKDNVFGVDTLGRDLFSRVLYGARVSLQVALIATAISVFIGVVFGMIAGFYRGWVDTVISRFIDVLLAFPILLFGIGLASACSLGNGCLGGLIKPGLTVVVFVIAFVNWTYIARIVRGQVLSLREKEFIEASRSLGASNFRIVFREVLPNLVAPIIVYTTLIIPQNILFLGVGVQPPQASWGQMLAEATDIFDSAWWYMVFPGTALLLTVLAFNLLGDGLQDALNPRAGRNE